MRKKFALISGLVVALTASAVAFALGPQSKPSPLVVKFDISMTKAKGTKKKPVPVEIKANVTSSTADGSRPQTWKTIPSTFAGIKSNGKYFPTCTMDQIDQNKSDSKCPKGALVATGTLDALIGPENDFSVAGAKCHKTVHYWNAGQDKIAVLLVGPGSDCAGVEYTPPFPGKYTHGTTLTVYVAKNVSHPLPGVLGSTVKTTLTFLKKKVKVKGVTHGYLESTGGCSKGKRKYDVGVTGDPDGVLYHKVGTVPC